ncbi:MAG: phycobilisome linker polypeptide [Pseudanabaena sp.]
MKSLDINTASTNFGAYNSRRFLIEFTGGNFTERLQGATTHTVIVPYSSLSRKLQTIQRLGGKIINVSIHPQLKVLKVNPENAASEQINEPIIAVHHEISPKKSPKESVEQPIAETLENGAVEVDEITSGAFPEPTSQTISEINSKEVSESNS